MTIIYPNPRKGWRDIQAHSVRYSLELLRCKRGNGASEFVLRALLNRLSWAFTEACGKYKGCPYVSSQVAQIVRQHGWRKNGSDFRHEHLVPRKMFVDELMTLPNPTLQQVERIFRQRAIGVVITKAEHDRLHEIGLGRSLPVGADGNPWMRYAMADLKVIDNPDWDDIARSLIQTANCLAENGPAEVQPNVTETGNDGAREFYLEYWTSFRPCLEAIQYPGPIGQPRSKPDYNFPIRIGGCRFNIVANRSHRWLAVEVYLTGARNAACFDFLHSQRDLIEAELSDAVDWEGKVPHGAAYRIRVYRRGLEFENRENWLVQHRWAAELLRKFYDAFFPRLSISTA